MSVLGVTHPTLLDVSRRLDPDGKVDKIVEILNMTNEVLDDAVWLEGNLPTGHQSVIRTGLPTPTWRKLYGGVQPTKSQTAKIVDTCGMLEDYAEIDKALADLNGNTAAFRMSEDSAHLEGFNEKFSTNLFYGSEVQTPESFTGFAPRFNSLSANNGGNVLVSGSGSAMASIWLIVWGPQTAFCIYPKGSVAGFHMEDKGQVTIENIDGLGGRMEAYRTHYRWDCGLVVKDWRYIVRGQVDTSTLTKNAAAGADIIDIMTQMIELLPNSIIGRPVFYVNRRIRSFLRRQIVNKVAAGTLTMDMVAGKKVMTFDGIPVKRCDVLLNTETNVS
jgi:hypothetical protein